MRCVVQIGWLFLILLSLKSINSSAGLVAVATLDKMNGQVMVNGNPAKDGDELDVGTKVKIKGADSWVDFKFQNGHVIRAHAGEFKVIDINPEKTLIQLVRGKLLALVKKLGPSETFRVKTKRAAFGVRGTKFMIEETSAKSYLCVCEGIVEASRGKAKVSVKKDQDLNIQNAGALKVQDSPAMGKMVEDMFKVMEKIGA